VNYLRQVQRGIDFIEAHLDEEIPLGSVARHAGVSAWHFQRIFKGLTGDTLKSYIRARRLAMALDALLGEDACILAIALASGFESQAAFTRAFKAAFGTTPAKYRSTRPRFGYVRKMPIDRNYIEHIHENVASEPELRRLPSTRFVGLRTTFYGVESDKCNLGEKLPPLWDAFLRRIDEVPRREPGQGYGVIRPSPSSEKLEYWACVATPTRGKLPRGMVETIVPAATYAVFAHRGLPSELHRTVNYIYASWLLRSKMRHTYGPDLELYGQDYIPDSVRSIIRYAIPVAR
jgi:AraC family transcriptional regulator